MVGVYLQDGTSFHFDQEKYCIIFEGMTVLFILKKEYTHKNRPDKMVIDYATNRFDQCWNDGYSTTEVFKGMI